MFKKAGLPTSERLARRRRFSPLMLIGVEIPLLLILIAGAIFVVPHLASHAADPQVNGDCTLIVPPQPLTARGLATPYQLMATNRANGPCHEANADQAAFVQAAIIDPATGQISIYNPLVIDRGSRPAIAPVVPKLPAHAVVGIWFGFNGDNLTLRGSGESLAANHCVNGVGGSIFGQVAYCNAPAFFATANSAIKSGKLKVPPLGKAKDGLPCPTVRDFSVVDMDQSDNVTTAYLVTKDGRIAQMNAHNIAALQGAVPMTNGSDNGLLSGALDSALGCTPWMAPDLTDPGHMTTSQALDELHAAQVQRAPVALVPNADPMVLVNGRPNLAKLNAYRAGVDQPAVTNAAMSSTKLYCANMLAVAPPRMMIDARLTKPRSSPDPAAANSLFTFLAQRFVSSFEKDGLNCTGLLGVPDPISVKTNASGMAIGATINGTTFTTPVDCNVNGTLITGCNGTTTINGQTCSLMTDRKNHQIVIDCPPKNQQ